MKKVVSTSPTFGKYSQKPIEMLKEAGYELVLVPREQTRTVEQMAEVVKEADALIVGVEPVTEEVIAGAKKLKVIAKHGAGVDNIDLKAASKANIPVTNAPGANSHAVADYVFALMLSVCRNIPNVYNKLKNNSWNIHVGVEVFNKTIGVIGTGKIGSEVIRRAKGFNMDILAYDLYPNKELEEKYNVKYVSLEELLQNADFVTLHVDLTEQTRNLISEKQFQMMKKTSVLINTSRGVTVCEKSLYQALKDRQIFAAALDVFETEPVGQSPLLELDNFIGTPHSAGYTEEALTTVGIITAQNIIDELTGKGSPYVVNK